MYASTGMYHAIEIKESRKS